ncbi:hypothetical protein [Gloeocapsa sp. PCC 73106]|uniref:hypothetical protein n=1 Tax=Gloeocapsa sp. PCC 73106 TaxID=102232 RepID=UPI0002DB1E9E|nr:hypothetical protein [Gloeocapsa sp. PCC 73106]
MNQSGRQHDTQSESPKVERWGIAHKETPLPRSPYGHNIRRLDAWALKLATTPYTQPHF